MATIKEMANLNGMTEKEYCDHMLKSFASFAKEWLEENQEVLSEGLAAYDYEGVNIAFFLKEQE